MTQIRVYDFAPRVGRKKEFTQRILLPLRPGTLERIAAALARDEERTEFIRDAVEREIKRRKRPPPGSKRTD